MVSCQQTWQLFFVKVELYFQMNSYPKRWFYPAQVFAQFTSGDEQPAMSFKKGDHAEKNMAKSPKNEDKNTADIIEIHETGELTIPPDYAQVFMICRNAKLTVEEVKTSVNKRVEYILQTLRSHNVGKNSYTVDRTLMRNEMKYELRVEISVQFTDYAKCQEISNFLVEKLDNSVEVSRPSFHYAPGKLESLRRQSCILAVQNARVKALEIANSLNQSLGPAKHIYEQSTEEYTGRDLEVRNTEKTETFQELIRLATVTVITKVFVAFELKVKTKRRAK